MSAAAIVAGNPVVYKPSRATPVVGHTLLQIFQAAGLPSGRLQLRARPQQRDG